MESVYSGGVKMSLVGINKKLNSFSKKELKGFLVFVIQEKKSIFDESMLDLVYRDKWERLK